MSYNFRWYPMPNRRVMAKMPVSPGLTYVVNFIKEKKGNSYTCFFYPSVNSANQMSVTDPTDDFSDIQLQEKIYQTIRNILREFADKYKPDSITFTVQFLTQLDKVTTATVPGYSSEKSKSGRLILKKRN